jgi:hypothetical protein
VDGAVPGEQGPEQRAGSGDDEPGHHPADHTPADHPGGHLPGAGDVTGTEVAAGDRLRGDGDGVEGEGQERPDGHRQLVGRQVHRLVPRTGRADGHGVRREQQRGAQGEGPDDQGDPGVGGGPDAGKVRAQAGAFAACGPNHDRDQSSGTGELGEDRAPGGAGQAEALDRPGAVDEQQVEGDVERVPGHRHDERGAGVLKAAQDACGRQHHQQWRGPEEGDPQVRRRRARHGGVGAEEAD